MSGSGSGSDSDEQQQQQQEGEVVYHDGVNGPDVTWNLQNVQTGEWVAINGTFDQGSNITNIPESYASRLGVDLQREHATRIATVGGNIEGYVVDMVYQFGGKQFKGPVIFRPDTAGPLLGANPTFQNFNLYFDNYHNTVEFIPISLAPYASNVRTNSIMELKRMVAYGVALTGGRGLPKEFL